MHNERDKNRFENQNEKCACAPLPRGRVRKGSLLMENCLNFDAASYLSLQIYFIQERFRMINLKLFINVNHTGSSVGLARPLESVDVYPIWRFGCKHSRKEEALCRL